MADMQPVKDVNQDPRIGKRDIQTGEITKQPETDMLGGVPVHSAGMLDLPGEAFAGFFVYLPDGMNGEPLHEKVREFVATLNNPPKAEKAPAEMQAAPRSNKSGG